MRNFKLLFILFLKVFISFGQSSSDPSGTVIYNKDGNVPVNSSALLEVRSDNKGMLPPRMTTSQINNVASPATGLMIYDTDLKCLKTFNGIIWECAGADIVASTPLSSSFSYRSVADNFCYSQAISADNAGNTVSVGYFRGAVTFGKTGNQMTLTSLGEYDSFITKHDKDGNLIWATQIGGSLNDQFSYDVALDNSGNIAVTGSLERSTTFYSTNGATSTYTTSSNYSQIFVAKYNSAGVLLWRKVAGSSGNYDCYGRGVNFDPSGNVVFTGRLRGTVSFDAISVSSITNTDDIFVAKLSGANGIYNWVKTAGGSSNEENGFEIVCDNSSNIYINGRYTGTANFGEGAQLTSYTSRGVDDVFVAKYNSNGILSWVRTAGNVDEEKLGGIAYSSAANAIYICGGYEQTMTFGPGLGSNPLSSVGSNFYYNGYIAKYDLNGNIQWSAKHGNTGSDHNYSRDVAVDDFGNAYVAGEMQFNTYFYSANNSSFYLRGFDDREPFLAKYNPSGDLQWAIMASDGDDDFVRGLAVKNNTAYVFGNFKEAINFGYQQLNSTTNSFVGNTFIWRYSE